MPAMTGIRGKEKKGGTMMKGPYRGTLLLYQGKCKGGDQGKGCGLTRLGEKKGHAMIRTFEACTLGGM